MGYGTDGLTFRTLRNANLHRLPMFRDNNGRVCHSEQDGSDWSPAQWLQAVVGELGEYANLRKKVERGDYTAAEAKPMLADELADVVIYLDILASQLGINLGDAVMHKWNKTSEKVGCPMYIDAEDWHYTRPLNPEEKRIFLGIKEIET
jgi:NTP pyrophosphatase (non-canonical NTP hydrolase)